MGYEKAHYSLLRLIIPSLRRRTGHIAKTETVLLPHLLLSRMHWQGFDLEALTCVSYANSKFVTLHRDSTVLANYLWQKPSSFILYAWRFRRFDLLNFYAALYRPLFPVTLTLLFPYNFVKESFHDTEYRV